MVEVFILPAVFAGLSSMTASVTIVIPVPAQIPVLSTSPSEKVMTLSGLIEIVESVWEVTPSKRM